MLDDRWGWRARLGILVIDTDPVAESEFWAMVPPGVTVHAARFESPRRPGTDSYGDAPGRVVADSPDVLRGLEFLGRMRLDAICVCFVTSSFLGGNAFDESFRKEASGRAGGIPVTTAAAAITDAAHASGIRRPLLVLPPWFKDEIVDAAEGYLAASDLTPSAVHRFDPGPRWRDHQPWETWDLGAQWEIRPEEVWRQVRQALTPDCDGIIIGGSGFRAVEVIEPLEADTGLPVVTSNQAGLWHSLRLSRVAIPIGGAGALLRTPRR